MSDTHGIALTTFEAETTFSILALVLNDADWYDHFDGHQINALARVADKLRPALSTPPAEPRPPTLVDYWVDVHGPDAARWRTAHRTEHWCSNQRLHAQHPQRCPTHEDRPAIAIGDRYFDTAETIDQWRTAKLCPTCALTPTTPAAGDTVADVSRTTD